MSTTRARKTITVESLRDKVNFMIEATPDDMTRERQALAMVLESVLHDTGNYHGFQYRDIDHSTLSAEGYPTDSHGGRGFGDETRRRYY